MSTRGFISFVIDGEEKTAYNHYDSYPDALGLTVLHFLWAHRHELTCDLHRGEFGAVAGQARRLRVVDGQSPPTAEDVERFAQFSWNAERHGGDRDLRKGQEWYDLLHETMGKPDLMLEAGVIEDGRDFPRNSLFTEWGYVVDLDEQRFEVYRGFQTAPHERGRFAAREPIERSAVGTYYPVALAASWPLSELPSDENFGAALSEPDEDE